MLKYIHKKAVIISCLLNFIRYIHTFVVSYIRSFHKHHPDDLFNMLDRFYTLNFFPLFEKNVLTTKTCNADMEMMTSDSKTENQKIRRSVDFTVEKFLFSRVRKYFCVLATELIDPDRRNIDSSTSDV